jgi:hypothetical protein
MTKKHIDGDCRDNRMEKKMNYQNQKDVKIKPKSMPIFASIWVALYVTLRDHRLQNQSA